MKKRLIIALAIFVLMACVTAHAGKLTINESTINYGAIKEGPPVVHELILTNTGDSALDISNVKAN